MTPTNPDPNRRNVGSMSDDGGNGTTKQKIKEDARDVKREVGARAREQVETGQHQLSEGADALSDAIDAAASSLDDHDRQGLARYARVLSSNLSNAAGQLEGRTVDELADDAKRLARNNPALFMLGSIAVGFGLSRFFKASAERDHHDDDVDQDEGIYRNEANQTDSFGTDDTLRQGDTFRDDVSIGTPVTRRERDMAETYTTSTAPRSGGGDIL